MVLNLIPECRICNGSKYYREPDPAGRGQLERCHVCNAEPARSKPDLVTVRREDLMKKLISFLGDDFSAQRIIKTMEDAANGT